MNIPTTAFVKGDYGDPFDPVISAREAAKLLGVSETHIYRLSREGQFVDPVWLGQRRKGYRATDVRNWVNGKKSFTTSNASDGVSRP